MRQMNASLADDFGKLILRLTLGILMLLHGLGKLGGDIGFLERMLRDAGLPAYLSYGVYVGEILAPLMILAGWYARVGALLLAINMVFAVALAHRAELFLLTRSGGWALELQGLYLFGALALAFTGPGRFGFNRR
jgi:putative oxidoreductase